MRVLPVIGLIQPFAPTARTRAAVRHVMPGADTPVAMAVEVPSGVSTVHLPAVSAPLRSDGGLGDTRAQTRGVLRAIEAMLRRIDLAVGDIIGLRVALVGVPGRDGRMDLEGFSAAYREFFGASAQPVRSVMQVVALADPSWLVEIEATAARPAR